jgi:transcriptional regulator with XRE-family HTH domain
MCRTLGTAMPADLGHRLRELRKNAGLSQEKSALETGLSARVIGDYERGYRIPRLAYLRVLAALYGVSLDALVDAEQSPEEITVDVA